MIKDNQEQKEVRLEIDLSKLEEELKEMGVEEGVEIEIVYNYEDYEGTYGS